MSTRSKGLLWALVCCPALGLAAAWYGNQATQGRLGTTGAVVLMGFLPAAMAGAGNALLGRRLGEVVRAAIAGGSICFLAFALFVLLWVFTVPPEFFT